MTNTANPHWNMTNCTNTSGQISGGVGFGKFPVFVTLLVTGSIAIVENVIALYLLIRRKHSVITSRAGFTISLATADFLLSLLFLLDACYHILPPELSQSFRGSVGRYYVMIVTGLHWANVTASMWSLFAVVLGRFVSVRFPLDHEKRLPKPLTRWICLAIWLISYILNFISYWKFHNTTRRYRLTKIIAIALILRVPPALGIIITYFLVQCVAFRARRRSSRFRVNSKTSDSSKGSLIELIHDAKKSILLFCIACLLQLLGSMMSVAENVEYLVRGRETEAIWILYNISKCFIVFSAAVNPWIHTFRRSEVWKPCVKHLTRNKSKSFMSTDETETHTMVS